MDRKYVKVLALMQKREEGRIDVHDKELVELLGSRSNDEGGPIAYRIANYISEIRRFGKLEVNGIRDGRAVVAYQLVALTETAPAAEQPVELPASV